MSPVRRQFARSTFHAKNYDFKNNDLMENADHQAPGIFFARPEAKSGPCALMWGASSLSAPQPRRRSSPGCPQDGRGSFRLTFAVNVLT
jgi:hypothetical protein